MGKIRTGHDGPSRAHASQISNPQPIELEDSPVVAQKEKVVPSEELVEKEKDFTNVEFEDLGEEGA